MKKWKLGLAKFRNSLYVWRPQVLTSHHIYSCKALLDPGLCNTFYLFRKKTKKKKSNVQIIQNFQKRKKCWLPPWFIMSLNDSVGLLSHGTMGPVVAVVGALLETRASPSFSFGCAFQSFQMKRYVPSIKLSKSKKMKKKKMYSFFSIFSKKTKCGLRPLIAIFWKV